MSKEKKFSSDKEEFYDKSTTIERQAIIAVKAMDSWPIDAKLGVVDKDTKNYLEQQKMIPVFRENVIKISVLKPLILEGSASAFKILMTLVAEGHDKANEFAMELRDGGNSPRWLVEKLIKAGQELEEAENEDDNTTTAETKASDTATSKANKPEVVKATTNNHVDEHPPVVDNGCSCIVSYMTEIVYDNPALNQKDGSSSWGKGLFSFVDKFNFDPKALIRAERELEHTYSAGANGELNFAAVFAQYLHDYVPSQDKAPSLVENVSNDHLSNILGDYGVTPAGIVSFLAAAATLLSL